MLFGANQCRIELLLFRWERSKTRESGLWRHKLRPGLKVIKKMNQLLWSTSFVLTFPLLGQLDVVVQENAFVGGVEVQVDVFGLIKVYSVEGIEEGIAETFH